MKINLRFLIILILLSFTSCRHGNEIKNIVSPSSKYSINASVGYGEWSKVDGIVHLTLLNSSGQELDKLETKASDYQKWVVTWYNDSTIVMDSHDIGIYAWRISSKDRFQEIPSPSDDMARTVQHAFIEKYGSHRTYE